MIVTATKSNINKRETGASVTIITEKEIEERGKANVIDLLKDVPGLTIVREADFGGKANVFIRGAKSGNTSSLSTAWSQTIPPAIDRSSILRPDRGQRGAHRGAARAQSLLYGSDATGGVINIITKRGRGAELTVKAEADPYSTFRESVSVNGGADDAITLRGIAHRLEGFSQADRAPRCNRSGKDGYYNTTLSSPTGMRVLNDAWLDFALRYTDAKATWTTAATP